MILAKASVADLSAIMELELTGFSTHSQWSENSWASEIDVPGHLVLVDRDDEQIRGAAAFSVLDDTCELLRVVVEPDQRRHGAARRLLEYGLDWAEANGAERVMLEVHEDNKPAIGLYQKLGFVPIAKRNDYYGAGRHAIVMQREVAENE